MWHGLLVARERLPGYGLTPLNRSEAKLGEAKPGSNALYELSNNIRPDYYLTSSSLMERS